MPHRTGQVLLYHFIEWLYACHAGNCRLATYLVPRAKHVVMTAGSPSGMAAYNQSGQESVDKASEKALGKAGGKVVARATESFD